MSPETGCVGDLVADVEKLENIRASDLARSESLANRRISKDLDVRRYQMVVGEITQVRQALYVNRGTEVMQDARHLWRKVFDLDGYPRGAEDADDLRTGAGWIRHSPAFLNVDQMVMTLGVLREARLLAVLLRLVVLLTSLEQAILASVVVPFDLLGVVSGTLRRRALGVLGRCGLVELLVARVVLVAAAVICHVVTPLVYALIRQKACPSLPRLPAFQARILPYICLQNDSKRLSNWR